MATVGFSVTDEEKAKYEEIAEEFEKTYGGSKKDFFAACIEAFQSKTAKEALSGRADEINNVERMLNNLREAYMYSLSMAKMAQEQAETDIKQFKEQEIIKEQKLKESIANLTNEKNELIAQNKELTEKETALNTEIEQLRADLESANIKVSEAETERRVLIKRFNALEGDIEKTQQKTAQFDEMEKRHKEQIKALEEKYNKQTDALKAQYEEELQESKKATKTLQLFHDEAVDKLEGELKTAKETLQAEKSKYNTTLEEKLNNYESKLNAKNEQIERLQKKIEDLQNKSPEKAKEKPAKRKPKTEIK